MDGGRGSTMPTDTTTTPPAAPAAVPTPASAASAAPITPVIPVTLPAAPTRRGGEGPDRRLSATDRRTGLDRRQAPRDGAGSDGPERRTGKARRDDTGLERRRGPGRRRSDDRRVAEEGEMNSYQ